MTASLAPDYPGCIAAADFVYRGAPLFVATSAGVTLTDRDGRTYLDAEAANGSAILGYDRTILEQAATEMGDLATAPCFCESAVRLRVAERLKRSLDRAAGAEGRIAFELGGAQGIELAIKLARHATRKGTFVVFEGAYHGRSIGTSSLSASHRYRAIAGTDAIRTIRLPYPDCKQCRFGAQRSSCNLQCRTYATEQLLAESCGNSSHEMNDIAGFIFEPLLNAGGMVLPDPELVRSLVACVRSQGGLILADEIFTGYYRTGPCWGFERFGITPDIVVTSKGLTNGMVPLSAVWARNPLFDPGACPPGFHSVTFGNNILALSIADVVLRRLDDGVVSRLPALGQKLRLAIGAAATDASAALTWDAVGISGRILLRQPDAAQRAQRARSVRVRRGRDGAIFAASALAPNALMLKPPYTIDDDDIADIETILRHVLND